MVIFILFEVKVLEINQVVSRVVSSLKALDADPNVTGFNIGTAETALLPLLQIESLSVSEYALGASMP